MRSSAFLYRTQATCARIVLALAALFASLPSTATADCLLGGSIAPNNDPTYCCSGAVSANGQGICTAVPACLPGGTPASLNNPGACCSQSVLIATHACEFVATCLAGGHPADLNNPGACCSQTALINGGNPVCLAQTTNPYAVGSVFIDLNKDKQQNTDEKGSDFNQNGALTVYAVNANGHIAGRSYVEADGFWRIESGLSANTSYTFVLSNLPSIANGIQSPPPLLPVGVAHTGENRSFDYGSIGVADNSADGKVVGLTSPANTATPSSYMNFGASDRIFANGLE